MRKTARREQTQSLPERTERARATAIGVGSHRTGRRNSGLHKFGAEAIRVGRTAFTIIKDYNRTTGSPSRHDAASSIEETLEDVITQRPLATVGLALGLGFLIGATWRR